ncbi:hypothetical protein VKA52_09935 [Halobacillus sp. HZG1]|uniref:hypothetical protein n=1 Tax=Halobacillus sp. HZG1 TaxID=3111769 RepID=UPI002DBEB808|nr:hypothetical protein [Halobacillus sp. HZG1]MEC3884042.1 hypothetical protein [Halobacillus sp. HZG1]
MDKRSMKEKLKWYIPPLSFVSFLMSLWFINYKMENNPWSFVLWIIAFIVLLPAYMDINKAMRRNKEK